MPTDADPAAAPAAAPDLFLGLDLGTSGARAAAIDARGRVIAETRAAMADHGARRADSAAWKGAAQAALRAVAAQVDPARIRGVSVDGTSGAVLALDAAGDPLGDGRMYDERAADAAAVARIAALAPATSAAHGATSPLARAIDLAARHAPAMIAHQADWIASLLTGRVVSDESNALKTGYDPVAGAWPDWIDAAGLPRALLPEAIPSGAVSGAVSAAGAAWSGLLEGTPVVAGATDGCASFLATGAAAPGDGVTALGTTLVLKILSDRPIFAPEYGIYSHRVLGMWLAGGASNSGGGALLAHFDAEALAALSAAIDPETDSGLDYHPLARPGERFPINDPALAPRLDPRPQGGAAFLHGLLDGIAGIEALGYRRLAELGAPPLRAVRTVGGGARNAAWTRIRERRLGVPMEPARAVEAAVGAARRARAGVTGKAAGEAVGGAAGGAGRGGRA
ncbi:FGGY-family carbohydrate kinase [Rhodovulum sp. DZ06]|uniref:FGGY-family carbohydrate kinase n=1 Tax=Rhodovulum sp. DZ06 TaxID=3425126 RepID=UPI003D3520F5